VRRLQEVADYGCDVDRSLTLVIPSEARNLFLAEPRHSRFLAALEMTGVGFVYEPSTVVALKFVP
jgi:hypothetical protein